MYKMKDVCRMTGLTEKAVRFYIAEGLITPQTEAGLHYRSFRFSESDVERLRDISALRNAEFSVADIRAMLDDPSRIPGMVNEREGLISAKIQSLKSVQTALQNLTPEEHTTFSQLADAIEPRTTERKETPPSTRNRNLWRAVYGTIFLLLCFVVIQGQIVWIGASLLLLLAGLSFPAMAIAYFRYNAAYKQLSHQAEGTVVALAADDGANAWDDSLGAQLHGLLNLGFFHWNWVRPDCWVPLIQFEANGKKITSTFRYGGLKGSWKVGQKIKVAWDDETKLYPCADPVISRKAWVHLALGIAALLAVLLTLPGLPESSGPDLSKMAEASQEAIRFSVLPNDFPHGDDYPIVWEDAGMEAQIRFLLQKPEGEILHSDVWDVQTLMIRTGMGAPISAMLRQPPEGESAFTTINSTERVDARFSHENRTFPPIRSLADLRHFDNLAVFVFYAKAGVQEEVSLDGLECCPGLKVLELTNVPVSGLSPLADLPELENLRLSNMTVGSLSPLAVLKNLKVLLLDASGAESLEPLRELTGLRTLSIDDGSATLSLEPITGLSLSYLSISSNNTADSYDAENLASLRQLSTLTFFAAQSQQKLDADTLSQIVENNPNLQYLLIRSTPAARSGKVQSTDTMDVFY